VELLEGRIDGLVFTSAPEAPLIQMLLQTPGIKLFDFNQAEAYAQAAVPDPCDAAAGIVDLGRNLPAEDYNLIAPTATLVAREDLHSALVDLFVQAAAGIHGGAGWFQQQGQFPSAKYTEIPVDPEAAKFYKSGPPFLQRYMTFWLANFFDRMWVLVVALGALILPLSKVMPPLYVWRIRSRVYRWYGQLRAVEQKVEDAPEATRMQVYEEQLKRLNEIEELVNQVSIPLSFADGLYGLRSHIQFVRKRIQFLMGEAATPRPRRLIRHSGEAGITRNPVSMDSGGDGSMTAQAPIHGRPALHQPLMFLRWPARPCRLRSLRGCRSSAGSRVRSPAWLHHASARRSGTGTKSPDPCVPPSSIAR
jgi:hypothetical protein